jgi:hypothetical protein
LKYQLKFFTPSVLFVSGCAMLTAWLKSEAGVKSGIGVALIAAFFALGFFLFFCSACDEVKIEKTRKQIKAAIPMER